MARYYRMTAKRRAALRKAQLASAKKRRRKTMVKRATVGAVAGAALVGGGAIVGARVNKTNILDRRIREAEKNAWVKQARGRWYKRAHSRFVSNALNGTKAIPRVASKPKQDLTTFGKTRIGGGVIVDKAGRQRGNRYGIAKRLPGQAELANVHGKRAFKVGSKYALEITAPRGWYDLTRREGYDPGHRRRYYINWEKPRRQARAAAKKAQKAANKRKVRR